MCSYSVASSLHHYLLKCQEKTLPEEGRSTGEFQAFQRSWLITLALSLVSMGSGGGESHPSALRHRRRWPGSQCGFTTAVWDWRCSVGFSLPRGTERVDQLQTELLESCRFPPGEQGLPGELPQGKDRSGEGTGGPAGTTSSRPQERVSKSEAGHLGQQLDPVNPSPNGDMGASSCPRGGAVEQRAGAPPPTLPDTAHKKVVGTQGPSRNKWRGE